MERHDWRTTARGKSKSNKVHFQKSNFCLGRWYCRCRVDNLFATFRSCRFHRSFYAFGHKYSVQNACKRREQAVCLLAAIIVGSLGKRTTVERLIFKIIFLGLSPLGVSYRLADDVVPGTFQSLRVVQPASARPTRHCRLAVYHSELPMVLRRLADAAGLWCRTKGMQVLLEELLWDKVRGNEVVLIVHL